MRPVPRFSLFAACALLVAQAIAADGVLLTARRGDDPGDVRLEWTGGVPVFAAYRSPVRGSVVQPANFIGSTSGSSWVDAPPPGAIFYYKIVGTCILPTTEVCDGVDNDCDAHVDEGCGTACITDVDCAPIEYCAGSSCAPDVSNGSTCGGDSQCLGGFCTDGICCDARCSRVCESCGAVGNVGACVSAPMGTDPDDDCGAVSCAGYYYGFVGSTCYRKADVSAAEAVCDGGAECQSIAQTCTQQSDQGAATITCNATCQAPVAGTCIGSTPGSCTNLNLGTQTCGLGVCETTVPKCSNGVPVTCVPNSGAATTETCNGRDDNCDGDVDNNAAFGDVYEPNDSCAATRVLPSVGSNQLRTVNTVTLYPSGDADYYQIQAVETDSSCSCCDIFCTDEDFRLTLTLTVPVGGGSYALCSAASCAGVGGTCTAVAAGTSGSLAFQLDGSCTSGTDSYAYFVRVSPSTSPGTTCVPYTLSYRFDTGCFGALQE